MASLLRVSQDAKPGTTFDVIFVHGLGGDSTGTWSATDKPASFWPRWLDEDVAEAAIFSLSYEAGLSAWTGSALGVQDRAVNILARLEADGLGDRPLVFIVHSLGGLVVKQMLRVADGYGEPASRTLLGHVAGIAFLATPHSGSAIATSAGHLRKILRLTAVMEDLKDNVGPLRDLNLWFRNNAGRLGIGIKVYFETANTRGIRIVDEASSDPGIFGVVPVPVDADHLSICKPGDRDALVYAHILRFLKGFAGKAPPVPFTDREPDFEPAPAEAAPEAKPADEPLAASRDAPPAAVNHRRQFANNPLLVDEPGILESATNPALNASPEFQVKLAYEMAIFLTARHGEWLGPACAAWRENDHLLLSVLPDFGRPQRTFAFRIAPGGLRMDYYWEPLDARLKDVDPTEWGPAVAGRVADRIPFNLNREATLLVLKKKGAPLGYPVSPDPTEPPAMCAWVENHAPPEDYFEWGRDPRLVAGKINIQRSAYHRPTGVALHAFSLEGRWSPGAFVAINEAFQAFLPSRYSMAVLDYGQIWIAIFLGYCRLDAGELKATEDRLMAAITRMVAAFRDIPLPPPSPTLALPEPDIQARAAFADAVTANGDRGVLPVVDQADPDFGEADWIKLRHARFEPRVAMRCAVDLEDFDFRELATPADFRARLDRLER